MSRRKKSHNRTHREDGDKPPRDKIKHPNATTGNWLYGQHAVLAALANPRRGCKRLLVTAETKERAEETLYRASEQGAARPAPEIVDRTVIQKHLPEGAVHQGMALQVTELPPVHIEDLLHEIDETSPALVVLVDQGTDPRNIGAILRSAAAFGANAVMLPDRHAPEVTGVMAKAASGALETTPIIRVTNLSRAIEQLKSAGFWAVGLDGEGNDSMDTLEWPKRAVLVLGAEGKGLRRLTREHCDFLVRIPMTAEMESLNLSNAAAIALYEAYRQRTRGTS